LKGNAGFAGLPGVYMVFHKITEFLRPFNEGRAALTIEDLNILEKISYILETSLNSIEKNETISEEKGKQLLQPLKL